jgi:G3E family GTPase
MWVGVINGFLGSGKTTFIVNLLREFGGKKRIAILVNELGEVGIDGSLIRTQTAEVIELTNGCICCTLTPEIKKQLVQIKKRYNPDLLLIEPTGAASVSGVLRLLSAPGMEDCVEGYGILLIIDAARFLDLYNQNRYFMEGQIKPSSLVVINKCDKVSHDDVLVIKGTVLTYNPEAEILMTRFGRISLVDWERFYENKVFPKWVSEPLAFMVQAGTDHCQDFNYETFSWTFDREVKKEGVALFLERLKEWHYGEVVRAKGLVNTDAGWFRIDYLPRDIFWEELNAPGGDSRLFIIGVDIRKDTLINDLKALVGP